MSLSWSTLSKAVKKDGVYLAFGVQSVSKVADCGDELSFTAVSLPESLLESVPAWSAFGSGP